MFNLGSRSRITYPDNPKWLPPGFTLCLKTEVPGSALLAVGDIDSAAVGERDRFDLEHQLGVRQGPHLTDRVSRIRLAEYLLTQLNHLGKMGHVGDEDGDLDHLIKTRSRCFEDAVEVADCLAGLSSEVANADDFTLIVDSGLSRHEDEIANPEPLGDVNRGEPVRFGTDALRVGSHLRILLRLWVGELCLTGEFRSPRSLSRDNYKFEVGVRNNHRMKHLGPRVGWFLLLLCACSGAADQVSTELLDKDITNVVATSIEASATTTSIGVTSTTADTKGAKEFDVTILAPESATAYSEIEIKVASEEDIVATEIVSDRLVLVSSTKTSAIVRTPIVVQNQVIDYSIQVSTANGHSKRMSQQIEVVLYEHDVARTRHLNPADLEGTSTEDYAVFNFGFETVFVNERYSETYCYPTLDNCNELDGSFTADAHNMMVGDFNGDGHQDLVVGWVIFPHTLSHKERSTVRVYLNDGTGRLIADPTIYASGAPTERNMSYRLVVDDFNLDGVDDIFAGSQGLLKLLPTGERVNDMDPHVLLLSRDGKLFDASDTIDYRDTIFFAHDASSGDINGDGFPDILAARTLFLNDGGAGFVNSIENLPEGLRRNDHYVMSSLLEDFNGDGLADPVLFWGDETDSLNPRPAQIAISDQQKPSAQWKVHSLPTGPFGLGTTKFNYAAAADIDGDGDADIVIGTTRAGSLYYVGRFMQILRNDGSGNFTDISQDAMGEQPRALNYKDPEVEVQCTVWGEGQVVLLDIDNDGDIDITDRTNGGAQGAEEACPGIEIYLNDGNGSFSRDESSQLAWVRQHQIPGFVALAPTGHQIGNAIPIDLDGRFGIDYVAQIRSPWGGLYSFLYQVMSLR